MDKCMDKATKKAVINPICQIFWSNAFINSDFPLRSMTIKKRMLKISPATGMHKIMRIRTKIPMMRIRLNWKYSASPKIGMR